MLSRFTKKFFSANNQLIFSNINWLFAEKVLRLFYGVFVVALLARYLGPTAFGVYNRTIAFVIILSPLAKLGIDQVLTRELVKSRSKAALLGSALLMKFVGSILVVSLGLLITKTQILALDYSSLFVLIVSASYLFNGSEILDSWFSHSMQSKFIALPKLAATIIISILTVLFIYLELDLLYFFILYCTERLVWLLGGVICFVNNANVSIGSLEVKKPAISQLARDSWPLFLAGFAHSIHLDIDRVMIGELLGDEEVGIYSAGIRLVYVINFLPVIIANAMFPAIVKFREKAHKQYWKLLQRLSDILIISSLFICLTIYFGSEEIILLFFGEAYYEASEVLTITIFSSLFAFFGQMTGKYMLAENINRIQLFRTFLGAGLNVVLNIYLIPKYGIVGAACSTLASTAVQAWVSTVFFSDTRKLFFMFFKSLDFRKSIKRVLDL